MKSYFSFRPAHLIFCIIITLLLITPSLYGQDLPGPIVYSVSGMDKVKVQPDIIYKNDEQGERKMDVYIPPDLAAGTRLPAVIFVHGGPVGAAKGWPFFQSYGKLMAASGLVGVTFNHRYTGIDSKAMETSSTLTKNLA